MLIGSCFALRSGFRKDKMVQTNHEKQIKELSILEARHKDDHFNCKKCIVSLVCGNNSDVLSHSSPRSFSCNAI